MENETTENKTARATNIVLNSAHHSNVIDYCGDMCSQAKLLKNATIFRCRQLLFAQRKGFTNLTEHEEFVLNEFKLTEDKYPPISNKYYLPTYEHFDYLFKITNNPDYNSCLGKHTAQKTINQVREDFKNFFAAMKKYKADKTNFTGRPNLPNYARVEEVTITSSNQECYIFEDNGKWYLKLPKTKIKLEISDYNVGKLVHIKIKPFYDTYKISIVTEKEIQSLNLNPARILGIDLGVDNFVTTSNNVGLVPFIINGKELKNYNQYYNKQMAEYKSRLPKNQCTSKKVEIFL